MKISIRDLVSNVLIGCFLFVSLCAGQNEIVPYDYNHPISFNPEMYVCHQTDSEIVIDGKAEEEAWGKAAWSKSFVDIEGDLKPLPDLDTKVKMLYDSNYFYFYFKLEEPHIWASLTNRDDIIYRDDDIEIFIDPDGDSHEYFEFEWNAYNTLWDLFLTRPYRVDNRPKVLFEYNVTDIQSAVHIEGSINDPSDLDEYWSIEIAIPWFALSKRAFAKSPPKDGEQWRVNFSRVDWKMIHSEAGYVKEKNEKDKILPENNWVWSPTGRINMHMPEMWGYVQFSKEMVGGEVKFKSNPNEEIKWGLWQLYFQQLEYFKDHHHYSDDLSRFTIPQLEKGPMTPTISTTAHYFEITHPTIHGKAIWIIDRDGKIRKIRK